MVPLPGNSKLVQTRYSSWDQAVFASQLASITASIDSMRKDIAEIRMAWMDENNTEDEPQAPLADLVKDEETEDVPTESKHGTTVITAAKTTNSTTATTGLEQKNVPFACTDSLHVPENTPEVHSLLQEHQKEVSAVQSSFKPIQVRAIGYEQRELPPCFRVYSVFCAQSDRWSYMFQSSGWFLQTSPPILKVLVFWGHRPLEDTNSKQC
ncbi:hypothetical protein Hanom_Chr04g00318121 [Helianthus anomalus]